MARLNISEKLHKDLKRLIENTPPDERLPAEPALAVRLSVSRATLREAMRTFETKGLIRRKQGSGTFINHPPDTIESGLEILESIETLAKRKNIPVDMGDSRITYRQPTDDEQRILDISHETQVIEISRVINAEGRPAAYLIDILPENILPNKSFVENFSGSVLDLLLKRKSLHLGIARTEINAVTAETMIARALGIQRGDVLLRFKSYLYSDNQVINYSYSYFLPGCFRFHIKRLVG